MELLNSTVFSLKKGGQKKKRFSSVMQSGPLKQQQEIKHTETDSDTEYDYDEIKNIYVLNKSKFVR